MVARLKPGFSLGLLSPLVAFGVVLSSPVAAVATLNQVTLQDCAGTIRWVGTVAEGETSVDLLVALDPSIPTAQRQAILFSSLNTQNTGRVRAASVEFDDVTPGNWKLCGADGSNLQFSSVLPRSEGDSSTVAMIATGGVLGAASLAAISLGGSDSSPSSTRDGLSGDGGTEPPPAPRAPTGEANGPSFDPDDYALGAPAAPLSPYL